MEVSAPARLYGHYGRRLPLKVLAQQEHELRVAALEPLGRPAPETDTERWVHVLELSLLFASLQDAVLELKVRTVAEMLSQIDRVDALVATLSRLDTARVVRESWAALEPYTRILPAADEPVAVDTEAVVRSVRSLLVHCPIGQLESAANSHDAPELAHRCRLAFDGLRAFVQRHVHPQRAAIVAAGRVYADGRATIDEVAAMLGYDVPDVVALLEEHGFRRSVDGLRLGDATRRKRLEQIREDRLARGGEPDPSDKNVARNVIASQRIEGIDARPWLRS